MARRKQFKMSESQRRLRRFSESFRQEKVHELESGVSTSSDIIKEYEVSYTSIRRWLDKYGNNNNKPKRIIVESESDTKKLLELRKRVAELERVVGQKQLQIDFNKKMIELAEEFYKIDIKKKFTDKRSSTSGTTEKK
jgi:transposase-like protein